MIKFTATLTCDHPGCDANTTVDVLLSVRVFGNLEIEDNRKDNLWGFDASRIHRRDACPIHKG